ncbi:MAG: phytanoyl-CoA dioxygenase family protein [Bacteroidetes bacterium]|nr:phytanoyl-CoA dioxygenase family protein [Bacteroidota bacterium]
MESIFILDNHDKTFKEKGYLKIGKLDADAIASLIALNRELNIPDFYGCGYNCGMNSDLHDLRKKMQDEINKIVLPFTQTILNDFSHYTATFVEKMPVEDCFVKAHQDFSYTDDESIYPSFMCFIPLIDVDIKNAALGFIPYSHKFYDTIRAFPFPLFKTAVSENDVRLMAYMDIIPAKAGEMIFFNQNTIHGSFTNYSSENRLALSLSLVKNGENIYAYIHNPKTKCKTVFKYKVDNYFIVNYHNPTIMDMYYNGAINVPFEVVEEIELPTIDTSWENISEKLNQYKLQPNKEYLPLIAEYNTIKKVKN